MKFSCALRGQRRPVILTGLAFPARAMTKESYSTDDILRVLTDTRTIAMIGASPDPAKASHGVMRYLQRAGYRVIPVNPTAMGQDILGERVFAKLAEIPHPFEMINVFRRSVAIRGIVDELLPLIGNKGIRYLWLQLRICDAESAARARSAGVEVIMDRCLRTEHRRLIARSWPGSASLSEG
jgi:predicted CoA-binding protein